MLSSELLGDVNEITAIVAERMIVFRRIGRFGVESLGAGTGFIQSGTAEPAAASMPR